MKKPSLGVIFLTVMMDLLGFGIVMPFLTLQAREAFGVSSGTAALLGACYSAMQFLFMPLWGRLSDRIGRRPVLVSSVFFSALTMAGLGAALAWSNSIMWLFVARLASGIATANIGTAAAYIADITTPEERVKGMGLIGLAFGLGFVIGPGIGGPLSSIEINGRHGPVACFVAAAISLVNLVWALTSLPESLPPERRAEVVPHHATSPLPVAPLRRMLSTRGIAHAALANHLIILAFSGLEITYAMYASDAFSLTQGQVGGLFVLMGLTGALVQGLFIRRASGRFRETSLLYSGIALQFAGFLGFVAAPKIGLWALLVASFLIAVGNGFTQPSISAYISRLANPMQQGEMLSSNQSLSSLARMLGPMLAGYLYAFSPLVPFAGCATLTAIAMSVAFGMRHIQPRPSVSHATASVVES